MILVDTSVWVDHLHNNNAELSKLLSQNEVCIHPWIIGELACGNLKNRAQLLELLGALTASPVVEHDEVLFMIERYELMGRGIGYIDAHLLASTMLGKATLLWTLDKTLMQIAGELNLAYRS